ncbi:MAG: PTS sugar transporter subunit IIC, partial [Enterococcus thailandicus]|nr:PTS sugar transporter subunit IIC [Enterococcus thailandicus]
MVENITTKSLGLRKLGHKLSQLIMPNLSIFIAWGFLSFLTPYFSGELAQRLNEVSEWMLHLLLPILIGY